MTSTPPPIQKLTRERLTHAPRQVRHAAEIAGSLLTDAFHMLGLFAIGAATVWAAVHEYMIIMEKGSATVEDLLLLFIYLEIGAMVGIYFKTNRLPVRFIIYVSLTALTRHLIGTTNLPHHGKPSGAVTGNLELNTIVLSSAIAILALAVLLLRYGSYKFPSEPSPAYETDLRPKE